MATAVTLFDDNNRYNVERYAYCLCLRVRPVTIFWALLNLVVSLMGACYLLFQIIIGFDYSYRYNGLSLFDGICILLTLVFSAMVLFGIRKSKPSYILPFFSIEFIYYLIRIYYYLVSIYTRVNCVNLPPSMNELIDNLEQDTNANNNSWLSNYESNWEEDTNADNNSWSSNYEYNFEEYTVGDNNLCYSDYLFEDTLLFMTIILILKTYFLCVIWKCYRYLQHMKEFILPLTLNYNRITNEGIVPVVIVPQGNLSSPPDNKEATKLPDN